VDPILVPILAALAGVAVGGLVAEGREWLRITRDNARSLNRVLYAQLDVWHIVHGADLEAVLDMVPRVIAPLLGGTSGDLRVLLQAAPELKPLLAEILRDQIPTDLEERYHAAVNQLAQIDPLLAYRISGRPELNALVVTWRGRLSLMAEQAPMSESDRSMIERFNPAIAQETRRQLLKPLEEDIESVAKKCGLTQWRRVKRQLEKEVRGHAGQIEREAAASIQRVLEQAGLVQAPAS